MCYPHPQSSEGGGVFPGSTVAGDRRLMTAEQLHRLCSPLWMDEYAQWCRHGPEVRLRDVNAVRAELGLSPMARLTKPVAGCVSWDNYSHKHVWTGD